MGLVLKDRSMTEITLRNEHTDQEEIYELCMEFPFGSTRKRMTLVVRYGGQYYLLCKGADSIMLPRI